jgi:hypothetical protein
MIPPLSAVLVKSKPYPYLPEEKRRILFRRWISRGNRDKKILKGPSKKVQVFQVRRESYPD